MDKRIKQPKEFAFVPVNGVGKPQRAKDKRLIRRHVMHGRNLRIGVRPVPTVDTCSSHRPLSNSGVSKYVFVQEQQDTNAQAAEHGGGAKRGQVSSLAVRSCVSPFRFYHNLDACSQGLTFDFYTGSSAAICKPGMGVDFDLGERLWSQWVAQDATYTHPVLFCIAASYCILSRSPLGKTALYHLDKTIASLNQRLADPLLSLHDSTTCIVASLVLAFSSLGEHHTARVHMQGLAQMTRLRGGLGRFRHCAGLLAKVARCDLALAMHSGEDPVFLRDYLADQDAFMLPEWQSSGLSSLSMISDPYTAGAIDGPVDSPNGSIELIPLLHQVRNLAHHLNNLNDPLEEPLKQLFTVQGQNLLHNLQYQVLALKTSAGVVNPVDKALRLALLAFLVSASEVSTSRSSETRPPEPHASAENSHLKNSLGASCLAMADQRQADDSPPRDIVLWILLVGAVTVFRTDKIETSDDSTWLRDCWVAEIGGGGGGGGGGANMTWGELRCKMKRIAWIDAIHDGPGRLAFEALSLGRV